MATGVRFCANTVTNEATLRTRPRKIFFCIWGSYFGWWCSSGQGILNLERLN
jgi:hypothetical protein